MKVLTSKIRYSPIGPWSIRQGPRRKQDSTKMYNEADTMTCNNIEFCGFEYYYYLLFFFAVYQAMGHTHESAKLSLAFTSGVS